MTALLATVPVAAVQVNGRMVAEIGVNNIEAAVSQPALIRRDVPLSPTAKQTPAEPQADEAPTTSDTADVVVVTTTLAPTTSDAYSKAVLKSKPVAYWQLGDLSGNRADAQGPACGQDGGVSFGDPCAIAGRILGTPTLGANSLIPSNTNDKAISFDGSSNQEVVIPDSAFLNTNDQGYLARTIELWFEAGDLGGINRTVYEEGNAPHCGLSIYASDSGSTTELFMYAWDRGNNEVEFGTTLVNPDPIRCAIQKDTPYYVALVFSNADLTVTGYIKRPTSNKVELCGQMTGLPTSVKLRHHGHMGGNAIIGGVQGTTRATGTTQMDGNSHNFVGTIDEVAVYNRALPKGELQAHVSAAGTPVVAAPKAVATPPTVAAAP